MRADEEDVDFDPMSVKHRQIQSKNNEYQNRQFDRGYTPGRADPFAQAMQQGHPSQPPSKKTLSDSRKAVVTDEPRSYRDIMQMQQVQKEKQEAIDVISGKRSRFSDQPAEDDGPTNGPGTDTQSSSGTKRKFESNDNSATPAPRKRRRWDSTPGPASASWEETPHVAVAMTPVVGGMSGPTLSGWWNALILGMNVPCDAIILCLCALFSLSRRVWLEAISEMFNPCNSKFH